MTPRSRRRSARFLAALLLVAGLSSCARRIGWGVVLWSSPEGPLASGAVVPVLIKSSIQSLYVVGVPGTDRRIELPLWRLELYPTKAKARARVDAMGENLHLYMVAARDGLPLRKEAANSAKRVYRLREGETVKVLRKTGGEKVVTGGVPLAGDWYEVMAEGGEVGFVFSYAMRLYDESKEGPPALASAASADLRLDQLFARSWKPAYFREMIEDGRIDLDLFNPRFGLFADATRRQVRLELPGVSEVFNYGTIEESGGAFVFTDTSLRVRPSGDKRLDIFWAAAPARDEDEAGEPAGYGGRAAFVVLDVEPREVIRAEELRRQRALEAFVDATGGAWSFPLAADSGASGGVASGTFRLAKSRRFTWTGRAGLPAGFLPPAAARDTGDAAFGLYLSPSAAQSWDGAFTLRFDPVEEGGDRERADFLYRSTGGGVAIVPAVLGEPVAGTGGAPGVVVVGPAPGFEPFSLLRSE